MMALDVFIFFFNDTATTEIYTLSLHDALPIYEHVGAEDVRVVLGEVPRQAREGDVAAVRADRRLATADRKSTRLNSSHANISYAVFCLKKKTYSTPTPSSPISMRFYFIILFNT